MGRVVRTLKRVPGGDKVLRALGSIPLLRAVDRRLSAFVVQRRNPLPAVPVADHFEGIRLPASVEGRLVVSAHAGTGQGEERPTESSARHHRHTWTANWNYYGMEDNDLRGFVDGRFKLAWNQPTQVHVRLGRVQKWSGNGEWELFRVLHRWEGLRLAPGAELERARIEVEIEEGLDHDLEVFLYSVHKDWDPGGGGVHGNNNSLPRPGEVWWNEVAHGGQRWGLPGAGFASDAHPDADTPARPLARSSYRPEDRDLAFESPELNRYVAGRVASGEPLRFLLKLSDYLAVRSERRLPEPERVQVRG